MALVKPALPAISLIFLQNPWVTCGLEYLRRGLWRLQPGPP